MCCIFSRTDVNKVDSDIDATIQKMKNKDALCAFCFYFIKSLCTIMYGYLQRDHVCFLLLKGLNDSNGI